jgi:acetyl-CoA C-acetyltransferase
VLAESMQGGGDSARYIAVALGLLDVPGLAVNRQCASSLSAIAVGAGQIASGMSRAILAGGMESLSTGPVMQKRKPFTAGKSAEDYEQWFPESHPPTADAPAMDMSITVAHNCNIQYGITREAQDEYVVRSQQRVAAAAAAGKFAEEIVPITTTMQVTDKVTKESHEQEVTLDRDEGPRPDTTLAGLAALNPVYPGGTTTAGNASQLSDGAGAVVMMDANAAARRGLPILGLFRGMQLAAVAPEEMSIAIAPAIRKVMKHHELAMADVDLWELHEAYAVTTLYNQGQLRTPWETTNVNGGAVALGHPYGMSGIRYLGSTLLELGRRGGRRAIVGVCTAGGMSTAALLERA